MREIPPLAWVAIGIVIIIFIGVNVSLIGLLRDGPKRKSSRTIQNLNKATGVLRNPYQEENRQIEELSSLVRDLKKPPPENEKKEE